MALSVTAILYFTRSSNSMIKRYCPSFIYQKNTNVFQCDENFPFKHFCTMAILGRKVNRCFHVTEANSILPSGRQIYLVLIPNYVHLMSWDHKDAHASYLGENVISAKIYTGKSNYIVVPQYEAPNENTALQLF